MLVIVLATNSYFAFHISITHELKKKKWNSEVISVSHSENESLQLTTRILSLKK